MAAWHGVLDEVLRERRSTLIGYAALLTGNRPDAEDLVHDVVVRTFGRPRQFPSVNAADAYLRRAITNRYLDRVRSRRRLVAAMPRLATLDDVPADDDAGRLDVRAALGALSPRQRACVVLRFYEDLTVPDIAEVLGLSLGAVKRYLSDGIGRLNAVLGTADDVDDATADRSTADVYTTGGRDR